MGHMAVGWKYRALPSIERRILELFVQTPALTAAEIAVRLKLPEDWVRKSIRILIHYDPPLLNRVGDTEFYQLSIDGRKLMRVPEPPRPQEVNPDCELVSDRSLIVRALKEKPCTIIDLSEITKFSYQKVYYLIQTLLDRGVISIQPRRGKSLLYSLKSVPLVEPPKPLLTPTVVPLSDDADWRTWMERLLLETMGGPKIVADLPQELPEPVIPKSSEKKTLPKILIVGNSNHEFQFIVKRHMHRKCECRFFDIRENNPSQLQNLCRRMAHVFIRADSCSHKAVDAVRSSNIPFTRLTGNANRFCEQMEKFFQ